MHAATEAWDDGEVSRVLEILERYRPAPGQPDLRRFEWYYLWRQCQPSRATATLAHDYGVTALALTSDGSKLVVAVQSPTTGDVLNVWDIDRQVKLRSISGANCPPAVAISPDNRLLASTDSGFWKPALWDLGTGKKLRELAGHDISTRGVVFAPDGRLMATGGDDGTVKLWDPQTGMLVHSFDNERSGLDFGAAAPGNDFDYGLAFSPDGQTLAAGAHDGTVKFWNVSTAQAHECPCGTLGPRLRTGLLRDGKILATGGADRIVRIWNTADRTLRMALVGHTDSISSIDISPDAATVASAGNADGTVRIWDLGSGEERHVLKGHSGSVTRLRYAGNHRVVSGGAEAP